jgi:1,4-dihydroxy-2-naphthoate octaprenyltransferase
VDGWILACILCSALLIQVGTNFANDYADFKSGADAERRAGPQRVTQAGLLSPEQVKGAANLCFAAAVLFGIPLILKGGWPIAAIGGVGIACGWLYTAGPFPLGYNGLGELFVLLFFGFAAVMGTNYLLTGSWSGLSAVIALAPGMHAAALLAVNNLRDMATDIDAGKHTLAVRFGPAFARRESILLLMTPFLIPPLLWMSHECSAWIMVPLLTIQSARTAVITLARESDPALIQEAFLATARIMAIFGLLFALALALS